MATQAIKSSQLRLIFHIGDDEEGNPMFRQKNFQNVKPSATADNLYAVAHALASLQQYDLYEIVRNDSSAVIEE